MAVIVVAVAAVAGLDILRDMKSNMREIFSMWRVLILTRLVREMRKIFKNRLLSVQDEDQVFGPKD